MLLFRLLLVFGLEAVHTDFEKPLSTIKLMKIIKKTSSIQIRLEQQYVVLSF